MIQTKPVAPKLSARLKGRPHTFRSCGVMADATAAVVSPFGQSFLLRLFNSPPLGYVPHLLFLHPFAFRLVLLSCLLLPVRSRLQNDVCFLCFPPGFPAVPPYLVHTFAAFRQRATMSALTPPLRQTSGGSVPNPSVSKSRPGHFPRTVWQFDFGLPPFSAIFLIPGSLQPELERGAEVSPDRSCYFLSALSRTTPGFSSMRPLTSRIPARGFITTSRLAFHRAPYIRVRSPTAQTFASNPPGPRLVATPCYFGYPAQERSTGAGLTPASNTPCRAYWYGPSGPHDPFVHPSTARNL